MSQGLIVRFHMSQGLKIHSVVAESASSFLDWQISQPRGNTIKASAGAASGITLSTNADTMHIMRERVHFEFRRISGKRRKASRIESIPQIEIDQL